MKQLKYIIPAILLFVGLASCENMDWLHKEYLQDPSITSAKIPAFEVQSGFERVKVTWLHPNDHISKKVRIQYGLGEDLETIILDEEQVKSSIIDTLDYNVDINTTKEVFLCERIIDGLNKYNTYNFYICTLDLHDYPSLVIQTSAEIFTESMLGDNFSNVSRPTFYIYDNQKTDPKATGHRVVAKSLSGIINFFVRVDWVAKNADGVKVAEGYYDRREEPKAEGASTSAFEEDLEWEQSTCTEISEAWTKVEGLQNNGVYTFEYTYHFFPCVYRDKLTNGFSYSSICMDVLSLTDTQTVKVQELGWQVENSDSHSITKDYWQFIEPPKEDPNEPFALFGIYWDGLEGVINESRLEDDYPKEEYPHIYEKDFMPASYYMHPDPTKWTTYHYERMWDEAMPTDRDTGRETYMDSYWRADKAEYPYSLFIDLGLDVMLNRIGMCFARDFEGAGKPGIYELWVSDDDDIEDGILDGWEKIGTFSNSSLGTISYDDSYINGVVFSLFDTTEEKTKRCRYVRIRVLEDLSGATTSIPAISELFLYGIEGEELPPEEDEELEGEEEAA